MLHVSHHISTWSMELSVQLESLDIQYYVRKVFDNEKRKKMMVHH